MVQNIERHTVFNCSHILLHVKGFFGHTHARAKNGHSSGKAISHAVSVLTVLVEITSSTLSAQYNGL